MKKIYLYTTLVAAAMSFAACTEDYTDWADPQSYSQESQQSGVNGIIEATSSTIDLNNVGDENIALINLLSVLQPLSNDSQAPYVKFSKLVLNGEVDVPFTTSGNQLCVTADDLAAALKTYYNSLAYTPRECTFEVAASLINADGVATLIPIEDNTVDITVIPFELPANAKESAYYYVGGYNGWNLASPTPFEDKGDGTYELTITIGDEEWFCFAPQSAVTAQDWNALFRAPSNGCEDTFGFLDEDPTSGNSFKCSKGGDYTFVLDMNNYTFTYYAAIAKAYYFVGTPNGWDNSRVSAMYPQGGGEYTFTAYFSGAWDGRAIPASNIGSWDRGTALGASENGATDASGTLVWNTENDGNVASPEAGYWTWTMNVTDMTYYWTKLDNQSPTEYTNISLSGDFNGWGDTELTQVGTSHNWYILDLNISEVTYGVAFKANLSWDIKWARNSDYNDLYGTADMGGANNLWVDPGVYDVYFNDITGQFFFNKQ